MEKLPTDLEILEEIYNRYYSDFRRYAKKEPNRIARIRVPIEVGVVAKACGVSEDMIFGRIFYHFNKKYSYKNREGEVTAFFATDKFEGLSVNFPLVASIIADIHAEKKQEDTQFMLFSVAIGMAALALIAALLL